MEKKSQILVLDLATHCGWAYLEGACAQHPERPLVAECGTINFGSHTVKRYLNLEAEIKALFSRFKPELMIVEDNFIFKNVKTTAALNQLRGAVLLLAALHDVEVQYIDNNSSKKKLLGSTKYWNGQKYVSVTKDMMLAAVHREICSCSAQPEDDNAADAISLGFVYFDVALKPEPLPKRPKGTPCQPI